MRGNRNILRYGSLLNFRYKTSELIGRGSFGQVFAAVDTSTLQEMAIKIEAGKKNCKQVLEVEMNAMKILQKSPYVVRLFDYGEHNGLLFLVMERLGADLTTLRKRQPGRVFNLYSVIHLSIQMINIVESIHKLGLIHRDIKPSNFCIGKKEGEEGQLFLIDFSLARRYKFHSGKIKSPRRKIGFRGTSRFASVNSHRGLDLYPRDDLWSVWYTMVEMYLGSLPWEGMKDRKHVGFLKSRFQQFECYREVPFEFDMIRKYLFSLGYKTTPDYEYIRTVLMSLYHKKGFRNGMPLDWENPMTDESTVSCSIGNNNELSRDDSLVSFASTMRSIGGESVKSIRRESTEETSSLNNSFEMPVGMRPRSKTAVIETKKPRVPTSFRTKSLEDDVLLKRCKSFKRRRRGQKKKNNNKLSGSSFFKETKSKSMEVNFSNMVDSLVEPFDDPFSDRPRIKDLKKISRSSSIPGVNLRKVKKSPKKRKKRNSISLQASRSKKIIKIVPLRTTSNSFTSSLSDEVETEEGETTSERVGDYPNALADGGNSEDVGNETSEEDCSDVEYCDEVEVEGEGDEEYSIGKISRRRKRKRKKKKKKKKFKLCTIL